MAQSGQKGGRERRLPVMYWPRCSYVGRFGHCGTASAINTSHNHQPQPHQNMFTTLCLNPAPHGGPGPGCAIPLLASAAGTTHPHTTQQGLGCSDVWYTMYMLTHVSTQDGTACLLLQPSFQVDIMRHCPGGTETAPSQRSRDPSAPPNCHY